MNTATRTNELTPELVQSASRTLLDAALTAADASVTSNLSLLNAVHSARLAQLKRTLAAASAHPTPDHAAVASATAAVTAQQQVVARLRLVKTQSAASAPTVPAGGWAIWGHVYATGPIALPNYTVYLIDDTRAYQPAYSFAYTAADGAFALVFTPPASATPATTLPTLFLAIANDKGEQVSLSADPLALVLNQALYVDTILPTGAPALGDLPAALRATALPPTPNS